MPVVDGSDDHGVEIVAGDEFAEVGILLDVGGNTASLLDGFRSAVAAAGVGVAHSHDLDALVLEGILHDISALAAATDQAEEDLVVRADLTLRRGLLGLIVGDHLAGEPGGQAGGHQGPDRAVEEAAA